MVLPNGLRVRDIATVTLGTEDHVRIIAGDGRPAALLNITRQPGGNTLAIADSIAQRGGGDRAAAAAGRAPQAALRPGDARARRRGERARRDAHRRRARGARPARLPAATRASPPISASAIPLTMAITVFVMRLAGPDVQPDDARRDGDRDRARDRRRRGDHREHRAAPARSPATARAAIREAVQELIWPVTTSTITTVVVFLPLGLLEGRGRAVLHRALDHAHDRGAGVARAGAHGHPAAERAVHHGAATSERRPAQRRRARARSRRALDGLAGALRDARSARVLHRAAAVGGGGGSRSWCAASSRSASSAPSFLPEMDEGAFVLDYWTPGGTSLAESDRHGARRRRASSRSIAGGRGHVAAARRGAGPLRDDAEPRRHRRAPQAARRRAPRSSFEIIDDARDRINDARAAPAHRVRADPLGRDQRPRRRREAGGDQALRRAARRARSATRRRWAPKVGEGATASRTSTTA